LKELLGVTQSAANVSIVSGSGSGGESTGNSGAVINPALSRVSLFLDSAFLAVFFASFAETETVPLRKILCAEEPGRRMIVPRMKVTVTRTKRDKLLSRVGRGLGVLDIEDLLLYLSPETMNLEVKTHPSPPYWKRAGALARFSDFTVGRPGWA
jgi:hypothetical protein